MRLVLHRRVRSDVDEIIDYYERAGHPELARDFYHELRRFMEDAALRPYRNHFFKADLRLPSQYLMRFCRVAAKLIDFSGTNQFGVDFDVLLPIESGGFKCSLQQIADTMLHACS